MRIFKYEIRVRHDHGVIILKTAATNRIAAKGIVMAAERCPARAIESITRVKK